MKTLPLALAALFAISLPSLAEARPTADLTEYSDSCHGCGTKTIWMGRHSYCSLSAVRSGGSDGACAVRFSSRRGWTLVISDSKRGATQSCRAICIRLPNIAVRWTGAQPAQPAGRINPVGVWRHSPRATWTIKTARGGRYYAVERGLGNARGPAYFTKYGTFRIDYVTRDGRTKGYYEVRFSKDGKTAGGKVRELTGRRGKFKTFWRRIR